MSREPEPEPKPEIVSASRSPTRRPKRWPGRSRSPPSATASCACAGSSRTPTTSTSRPPRSVAASCARATRCRGRRARARRGEHHRALVHVDRVNGREPLSDRLEFERPDADPAEAPPVARPRSIRRPHPGGRPADPAGARAAGAGHVGSAIGPHDASARPRQGGRRGRGPRADRAADRRAARGGDRLARGGAGGRDRHGHRRPGARRAGAARRARPGARAPARRVGGGRGADRGLALAACRRLREGRGSQAPVRLRAGPGRGGSRVADRRRDRGRGRGGRRDRGARGGHHGERADPARPRAGRGGRVPGAASRAIAGSPTRRSFAGPRSWRRQRRLRSLLADLAPAEAAGLVRERIEGSRTNAELLASL